MDRISRGKTKASKPEAGDQRAGGGGKYLTPEGLTLSKSPSLQGIHAQSSTETSGLGETITSGFSSQESVHSGAEKSREESSVYPRNVKIRGESRSKSPAIEPIAGTRRHVASAVNSEHLSWPRRTSAAGDDSLRKDSLQIEGGGSRQSMTKMSGLHSDQVEREWHRRGSKRESMKSRSSFGGSFKSRTGSTRGSNKFLGRSTESAWMKWSKDRRASYQRRAVQMESMEKELDLERTSTPVKKARQEGLKFIHPDLEGKYLSEEDINDLRRHKQEKYYTYRVIEKTKNLGYPIRPEIHLTVREWTVVTDYWHHTTFIRSRYLGLITIFLTLLLMIVSITDSHWLSYNVYSGGQWIYMNEGLWLNCTSDTIAPDTVTCERLKGPSKWITGDLSGCTFYEKI